MKNSFNVILSEAKDMGPAEVRERRILRFAQDDKRTP